jgi:hypothetical protein
MNHLCCPGCRLRFEPSAAAYLGACPGCGLPPVTADDLACLVGFRLFTEPDVLLTLGEAAAAALPEPRPDGGRW